MCMREGWDREAGNWARFARAPGRDRAHEDVNLPVLRELLPPPGLRTLECLHDIDDLAGAAAEIGRVLAPGGRLCAAIVHPLNSAGTFAGREPDAPFVITGSYADPAPVTSRPAGGGHPGGARHRGAGRSRPGAAPLGPHPAVPAPPGRPPRTAGGR
jgi:hypothetical protein